jgi:hypothetical protein
MRIVIEPETPGDSRSLFRLLVGEKIIAGGLTAWRPAHFFIQSSAR